MLVPVALVLWVISLVVAPDDPDVLLIRVESQVTSERLAGASVWVGETRYISDEQGGIRIEPPPAGTVVRASADGHESMQRDIPESGDGELTLSLSGVLVVGKLVDAISEQPVEGAEVTVMAAGGESVASSHTDEYGRFIFKLIPENAVLQIRDDVYSESNIPIRDNRELLIALDPPPVTGRVVDENGKAIVGVDIRGPRSGVVSDEDGRFEISNVGQGEEIVLSFGTKQVTIIAEGRDLWDITPSSGGDVGATPSGGPE